MRKLTYLCKSCQIGLVYSPQDSCILCEYEEIQLTREEEDSLEEWKDNRRRKLAERNEY